MTNQSNRSIWFISLVGAGIAIAQGCSQPKNAPVDPPKARQTLVTALDNWKSGAQVDALQRSSPPIYVVDSEWKSGAKLKDYRLINEGQKMDANLFCPVELTVVLPDGKEMVREVTYMISTAPNLTVSRKLF